MSVKVIFMGRPTKDPVMSQSQNGTEYISLDVAVSQRGQTGNDETVFYQCYFSKGLADRLVKAKVKKGSCISIVGSLELHPFMYQQGNNAGKPGINANVRVLDWEYTISNRPENAGNTPNQSNHPNGYGQTGTGLSCRKCWRNTCPWWYWLSNPGSTCFQSPTRKSAEPCCSSTELPKSELSAGTVFCRWVSAGKLWRFPKCTTGTASISKLKTTQ